MVILIKLATSDFMEIERQRGISANNDENIGTLITRKWNNGFNQ